MSHKLHSEAIETYLKQHDPDRYLYKNTTAMGYTSNEVYKQGSTVILKNARAFKAGLMGVGAPDLLGFTMTEITPSMVGKKMPLFSAVEMKSGSDKARPEQKKWLRILKNCLCNTKLLLYNENDKTFSELDF